MKFLSDYLEKDPTTNITNLLIFFFIFTFVLIIIAFVYDLSKNKKNHTKISILERAIKDLIEEFRQFELSISDQKKILNEYKYTLERLDQEISRLADSSKGDSNITEAIKMANEGKTVDEISELTGLSKEEIEPIIKFHGR